MKSESDGEVIGEIGYTGIKIVIPKIKYSEMQKSVLARKCFYEVAILSLMERVAALEALQKNV